jgi:pyruvate dehydrogenase (quinone)
MASQTVADHLLARLREWGVQHVFGYPGDGINGLLAAWGRADDQPRFVQARHEEMAAFEAVGYAKFTDRVGFCVATSGPGAIHLLNGLYDAKLDHGPGREALERPQGPSRSSSSWRCRRPGSRRRRSSPRTSPRPA